MLAGFRPCVNTNDPIGGACNRVATLQIAVPDSTHEWSHEHLNRKDSGLILLFKEELCISRICAVQKAPRTECTHLIGFPLCMGSHQKY